MKKLMAFAVIALLMVSSLPAVFADSTPPAGTRSFTASDGTKYAVSSTGELYRYLQRQDAWSAVTKDTSFYNEIKNNNQAQFSSSSASVSPPAVPGTALPQPSTTGPANPAQPFESEVSAAATAAKNNVHEYDGKYFMSGNVLVQTRFSPEINEYVIFELHPDKSVIGGTADERAVQTMVSQGLYVPSTAAGVVLASQSITPSVPASIPVASVSDPLVGATYSVKDFTTGVRIVSSDGSDLYTVEDLADGQKRQMYSGEIQKSIASGAWSLSEYDDTFYSDWVLGIPASSPSASEPAGVDSEAVASGGVDDSGSVAATSGGPGSGVVSGGPPIVPPEKLSMYAYLNGKGQWVVREGKANILDKEKNIVVPAADLVKLSDAQFEFLKNNDKVAVNWLVKPDAKGENGVLEAKVVELSGDAGKQSGRILLRRSDESYREQLFKQGKITSDVETLFDEKTAGPEDDTRIVKTYYDLAGKTTSSITYRRYLLNTGGLLSGSGDVVLGQSEEPLTAVLPSGKILDYSTGKITDRGKELNEKDLEKSLGKADKDFYAEVKNLHKNYVYREVLDDLRFYGTEYSGIAAFSSLFFPDEFLQDWQKTIENAFCKSIIFGGADCWSSKLCQSYDDSIAGSGVLTSKGTSGEAVPVAHVEAERSLPGTFQNGSVQSSEFLYKITYYVRNGDSSDDLRYNLVFLPRGYQAFTQSKLLAPGQVGSASGQTSIVRYSKQLYTEVCLVFDHDITDAKGKKVSQVCNNVCGGVIDPKTGTCAALETAVWNPVLPLSGTGSSSGTSGSAGDFQNF